MKSTALKPVLHAGLLALAVLAPLLLPEYKTQLTFLCIMIVFALCWDIMGGQMGYNSFGNIVFFGVGMYACASTQVGLYYDLAQYTAASGAITVDLTAQQYFTGFTLGLLFATIAAVVVAALLGTAILGVRGHYFAIGTLGLGIAAGEIAAGIDLLGAGSGMVTPLFPGGLGLRELFFYYLSLALAIANFLFVQHIYQGRFGLALNAIRDGEDKAESLGLHTTRYKIAAWCISAFFLAIAGGLVGNVVGFIDPRDVAFAGATFGVWMVLMAILGGKGTLWGPVIGAAVFHTTQELFWTFLLGWQRVALGVLIVVIVVFFPQGILGWLKERHPARFGGGIPRRIAAASKTSPSG